MPVFLVFILSFFDICDAQEWTAHTPGNLSATTPSNSLRQAAQPVASAADTDSLPRPTTDTLSLQQLESKTLLANDTLYIVNFWATWCKPCVQELPFFEEAGTKFAESPVKILLVSLDMISDIQKVDAFAAAHLRKNEVYLFRGANPDVWINAIDPQWSGAIPATAFYRNGKKLRFHEGDFTQPELFDLIHSFLQ